MVLVRSRAIAAIGYDERARQLLIMFRKGRRHLYAYDRVSPEVHAAFLAAPSKGRYYVRFRRGWTGRSLG